jgi:hypothetical protein
MAHVRVDQPVLTVLSRSADSPLPRKETAVQIRRSKRILFEMISLRNLQKKNDLTSLRPAVLISLSKSAHSTTCAPATPMRFHENSHTLADGTRNIPLYSIGRSGRPPNVIIFVWCRSYMRVTKVAQVDAHFPLPTGIR